MNDNGPYDGRYEDLDAVSDSAFPKHCANCGAVYASLEDYVARTNAISGQSGLKSGFDDDERPIVELFRNCVCGSTLMDFFGDRRDVSDVGGNRRARFTILMDRLVKIGLPADEARRELLSAMRGRPGAVLSQSGITLEFLHNGELEVMDRCRDIIVALDNGRADTIAFFESLSPAQLNTRVYQDGANWTAQQVMAHFASIERSMHRLFENILSGGQGTSPDFDVDRFNLSQTRKMEGLDLPTLIGQFNAVRQATISIVEKMTESDLDRRGCHPFLGQGKLERFIRWAYEHTRIHEEEIRKVLD